MRSEILYLNNVYCTVYENGDIKSWKNNMLKGRVKDNEYLYVSIGTSNTGFKNYYIHRLVALAFIPNPDNLPVVNHKDSNRINNHVDNLEWCTTKDNIWHCKNSGRAVYPTPKKVLQFTIDGNFIREWDSPKDAAAYYDCTKELIQQCASINNYNSLTAKNYLWIYKEDMDNNRVEKFNKVINKTNEESI